MKKVYSSDDDNVEFGESKMEEANVQEYKMVHPQVNLKAVPFMCGLCLK